MQYPFVELLVSILYLLVYHQYGFSFEGFTTAIMVSLLIVASFIDLNHMLIPNKINSVIAITGVIHLLFTHNVSIVQSILGMIFGGGILFLMGLLASLFLKKDGMGGGDIKLAAAYGIFLGINQTLLSLLLATYIAGFVLLIMLLLKKLKKDQYVPFGPFLSAGAITAMLYFEPFYHILTGQ